MKVYEFEDLKTKKLVREIGERMDMVAFEYVDIMIDAAEQEYPEGTTDEEWRKFCDRLGVAFAESLSKAFDEREL